MEREPDAVVTALRALGFERFKAGQREVVDSVLAGRPTIAIMPTGAGKSLCYQLPSLLLPGVTLVVSPLVALMRDQVRRACARGLNAASLASGGSREERSRALNAIARREVRLVYASPEGLRSPTVLAALREAGVSLMCVDEAHCISAWGHDFRPDYARLGQLREALQPSVLLAVTATATGPVQADIAHSLGMEGVRLVVTGFDRPNLGLSVESVRGAGEKARRIECLLAERLGTGSAIVYCGTRRATEELTAVLMGRGVRCVAYHAGLPPRAREAAQSAWESGAVPLICATTAFGMGVDKPDVRLVVHHAIPRSPEAYYQEVGRAGRDGESACGVLLFDAADLRLAHRLLERSCPGEHAVRSAYARSHALAGADGVCAASLDALQELVSGDAGPASRAALVHLTESGVLSLDAAGVRVVGPVPAELDVDGASLLARAERERARLLNMHAYVHRASCRQAFLVGYFTGAQGGACGRCDLCQQGSSTTLPEALRLALLKTLSCVARMMGRYGRAKVADVLVGSKARAITASPLMALSTYGLLAGRSREHVLDLLAVLERANLVVSLGEQYPVIDLTEVGAQVLKRGELPPMWLPAHLLGGTGTGPDSKAAAPVVPAPDKRRHGAADPETLDELQQETFARLRGWRGEQARSQRVPPYVVMPDRTLRLLTTLRPRSAEELTGLPGLGRARIERYGEALIALLRG